MTLHITFNEHNYIYTVHVQRLMYNLEVKHSMQTYDAMFSVLVSCLCRTSLNLYRIESPVRYPPVFFTTAPIPEVHAVSASFFVESIKKKANHSNFEIFSITNA